MIFIFPPVIEIGLCALVFTAAGYDLRSRRIPNWLAATGLIFGVGEDAEHIVGHISSYFGGATE